MKNPAQAHQASQHVPESMAPTIISETGRQRVPREARFVIIRRWDISSARQMNTAIRVCRSAMIQSSNECWQCWCLRAGPRPSSAGLEPLYRMFRFIHMAVHNSACSRFGASKLGWVGMPRLGLAFHKRRAKRGHAWVGGLHRHRHRLDRQLASRENASIHIGGDMAAFRRTIVR